MIPVTVIGGYLGAGKTTLVNHLLRHAAGMRIAVLVNEFGTLPIDQDLIEAQDDNIISIAGGCICCSYGNDLVQAMMELGTLDTPPDHVVLESSGVALPGAIASSLSLLPAFRLDGIVVLADAETIRRQAADEYIGDTIERQLKDADIVVLNKADLVAADDLADTVGWLKSQTGQAEILPTRHCDLPRDIILQEFPTGRTALSRKEDHQAGIFETAFLDASGIVDAEQVAAGLADAGLGLVRAKGFVPTSSGLQTIQVVSRRHAVSAAPEGAKPGLVVIATKGRLDLVAVQQLLDGAVEMA